MPSPRHRTGCTTSIRATSGTSCSPPIWRWRCCAWDEQATRLDLARTHPERWRHTYWGDILRYVEALALAQLGRFDESEVVLAGAIRRVLG
ncbi:MAG: hypothetical protein R2695_20390 [Acidimicrobiales bacterium]